MAYRKKSEAAHARVLATRRSAPPPPPIGATHALKSGARSELTLPPIRERHVADLARDYPRLDARRLVLLADRLARIELAMTWLDGKGIVANRRGDAQPLLVCLEQWSRRAENLLREAEGEERSRAQRFDLAQQLAAIEEEDDDAA